MRKRPVKKKKTYKTYKTWDLSEIEQFSLCDALRQAQRLVIPNPALALTPVLLSGICVPLRLAVHPQLSNTSSPSSSEHRRAAL
jgi:hypothetical protein